MCGGPRPEKVAERVSLGENTVRCAVYVRRAPWSLMLLLWLQERSRLTSLLVASSQRIEFLDRDVSNLRGQLEVERSSASAK